MSPHLEASEIERAAAGEPLSPASKAHLDRCGVCRRKVELAEESGTEKQNETRAERPSGPRTSAVPRRPSGPKASVSLPSEKAKAPPSTTAAEMEAADAMSRGWSLGRYLILNMLGQGGMGSVYAAYDAELDRKVAIKVLRVTKESGSEDLREGQARLLREAQAMARVSHPNVIAVHDVGTVDDRVFVAMEFVDGQTLRTWCKTKPPWRQVISHFVDAGRGLAAAHAAGLVHRDFKPENVLLSKDGRVYVTDFGLARLTSDAPEAPIPRTFSGEQPTWLESPLTQVGTVMGTPNYMSPEQHLGQTPDARSDQFSFCAALYWAIWGKRPFDPKKLAATAREAASADTSKTSKSRTGRTSSVSKRTFEPTILEPPREPKIPSHVRKAILKGLALAPEDRYGSMNELLAELTKEPFASRTRIAAAAAVALVLATGGLVYHQHASEKAELCSGASHMLAGAWDAQVKEGLAKTFLASGSPFAKQRLDQVDQALDDYAHSWASMQTDACEATRLRGEQTEAVYSLRMICLDTRLKNLRELTRLLVSADATLVDRSAEAALGLPSIRPCADVASLTAKAPLPSDPTVQKKIGEIQELLAKGEALRLAGRYPNALAIAKEAVGDAEPLSYRPLDAEALYLEGTLLRLTGKPQDGKQALLEALYAADAGKADPTRVQVASLLIYVASQSNPAEGHQWAGIAEAALARMGGDQELQGELDSFEGTLDQVEGRWQDALEAFQNALRLLDASVGKDNPKRLNVMANLESVYAKLGQQDRAIAMLKETIAQMGRLRGADHPALAGPWANLADAYRRAGQYSRAHDAVNRALSIAKKRYGEKSPPVANFYDLEATIYQSEHRFQDALTSYQTGLAIKSAMLPANDPELTYSFEGMGQCLLELGKPEKALPLLEKAEKLCGSDPEELANIHFGLARTLTALGRDQPRAKDLAEQAMKGFETASQVDESAQVARWIAQQVARGWR